MEEYSSCESKSLDCMHPHLQAIPHYRHHIFLDNTSVVLHSNTAVRHLQQWRSLDSGPSSLSTAGQAAFSQNIQPNLETIVIIFNRSE